MDEKIVFDGNEVNYNAENAESANNVENDKSAAPKTTPQVIYLDSDNKKKGMPTWLKVILILVLVIVAFVLLMVGCVSSMGSLAEKYVNPSLISSSSEVTVDSIQGKYIGTIHIEGEINEDSQTKGYNHEYILKSIDNMMKDEDNMGIILFVDTPGGTVYASDDVYLKIREYQIKTSRPVYSSMQSQATSGGYYVSAPCDVIYANRNCWTGSIGVTMGSMLDISELLDNLGIKVNTITAGDNKAMGSSTEKLTKEQSEILQSLVDEAYEQFVGIVAEGRDMKKKDVKKLADGRIYTANQAKELGLIDKIGTYGDCVNAIKSAAAENASGTSVNDIKIVDFYPETKSELERLLGIVAEKKSEEYSASNIEALMDLNGKVTISYEAPIQK